MSMSFETIKNILDETAVKNREIIEGNKATLAGIADDVKAIEQEITRLKVGGSFSGAADNQGRVFLDVNGVKSPIIARNEKVSAFVSNNGDATPFSISDYVKAAMGFQPRSAVVSGPALVPTQTSSNIIDMVRAASTVIAAGAGTISIEGPTNLARITGDPTVYQHSEGGGDVNESDVTYDAVVANPKALVALVPLSAEVVGDSANLDLMLNTSIAAAFAAKLDILCLATILANASIPKSAVAHAVTTWQGTMLAVAAALALNQNLPAFHISNSSDFMTRSGQLASTAGSWLGKPPVLAGMLELATTRVAAGTALLGNMAEAFAIITRQNLNLEVIRFQKPGSYSHLLVAHARMDGVVLQPNKLFIQKLVP
ncbi:MAG: phage major capsid protein [Desulfuromonadaceae bacterium]